MTTLKRPAEAKTSRTAKARSGSVQPDCSAVLSALDTLCRKAEQDEYFRIWKVYPLGCGPLIY